MAVRPIDANAMLNELRPVSFEAEHSAVLLSDVSKMMREWVERQPTITPPNGWVKWVNRLRELDELYTKLHVATGFTAEQLLEMFSAGYTLEKPDYSKSMEEAENLGGITPPNEPLTLEQLREMGGEPVWLDDEKTWALLQVWDDDNIDAVFPMPIGCFHAESVIGKKIYRRPPEEVEKT